MKMEFKTFEAAKALGISRPSMRDWLYHKLVRPTHPSPGQGKSAIFSLQDLYLVQLFRELVASGLDRDLASSFFGELWWKSRIDNPVIAAHVKPIDLEQIKILIIRRRRGGPEGYLGVIELFTADSLGEYSKDQAEDQWDQMIAINFERLRERVKSALARLEES